MGADGEFGVTVADDFYGVDFDLARGDFEISAFASEFVGALTVDFDGAKFWRGLGNLTNEVS